MPNTPLPARHQTEPKEALVRSLSGVWWLYGCGRHWALCFSDVGCWHLLCGSRVIPMTCHANTRGALRSDPTVGKATGGGGGVQGPKEDMSKLEGVLCYYVMAIWND